MSWFLLWLLTSYFAGFYFIAQRAKNVLKLADENWPEGEEDIVKDVTIDRKKGQEYYDYVYSCDHKKISICDGGPICQVDFNKEDWISFSRGIHVFWFVTSPVWADMLSLYKFGKFVCVDINPILGRVFEADLNIGQMRTKELVELRQELKEAQAQVAKLKKKNGKADKKTTKKKTKKK